MGPQLSYVGRGRTAGTSQSRSVCRVEWEAVCYPIHPLCPEELDSFEETESCVPRYGAST